MTENIEPTAPTFPYEVGPIANLQGGMIHRAILAVVTEIPPVDKNGELELGGRKIPFTRVDEIRDAMNPILSRHGIVSYPRLIAKSTNMQVALEPMTMVQSDPDTKRILDTGREIRDGKIPTTRVWSEVEFEMRFVFVGDNSETRATAAGLAYDTNSDKSLAKAITQAIKRILMEVFKITDRQEIDPDGIGEDQGNRAATTDRREGGDRGQQHRTAAQTQQTTGSSRRSGPSAMPAAKPVQPSDEAVAAVDTATGEVPDDAPAPAEPPAPDRIDAQKGRVRDAVAKLKARDGEGSWSSAQVDAVATQATGKATRSEWLNKISFVTKVADALEAEAKGA